MSVVKGEEDNGRVVGGLIVELEIFVRIIFRV